MSKTNFSTKCEILGSLWMFYKDTDNEEWSDFFRWSDIGCPLAYAVWQNLVSLKPDAKQYVEETWKVFCEMIEISPEGSYDSLKAAFDASPNPPLED